MLLQSRLLPAQSLDRRPVLLRLQAALARGLARPGRPARDRRHRGARDQLDEALARVLPVALLGAVALRGDDEHAVERHPPAGEAGQPQPHVLAQIRRAAHVEAKLHRARELVDVLAARTGSADEALLELVLVDADRVGDADHLAAGVGGWPTADRRPDIASPAPCPPRPPADRTDRRP